MKQGGREMKTVNKLLSLLLLAGLILTFFAACGGGGSTNKVVSTTTAVSASVSTDSTAAVAAPVEKQINESSASSAPGPTITTTKYLVGNTKTKIFHIQGCGFVPPINLLIKFNTREEAIAAGYTPCEYCKP
jgi:hypothetical protein